MPSIARVGRVLVPVADQDRAVAFYRDVLGFEVRGDTSGAEGAEARWVEVVPPGAETALALVPPMAGIDAGTPTRVTLSSSDVAADRAALEAAGADVDELVDVLGAPLVCFFRDPDANQLVLTEA